MEEPRQLHAHRVVARRQLIPALLPIRAEPRLVVPGHRGRTGPIEHLSDQMPDVVPGGLLEADRGGCRSREKTAQRLRVGWNGSRILFGTAREGVKRPHPVLLPPFW